jgi:hypothetical protein
MSAALELIRIVEAKGGQLRVEDGWLVIAPGDAAEPVMEELRQHKPEIIELLAQRPVMPAGVRLVSYAPATPPVKLSQCETVMDTGKFIRSTLGQVDARLHNQNFLAGNWTLSELLARLATCGCRVALDEPRKALQ